MTKIKQFRKFIYSNELRIGMTVQEAHKLLDERETQMLAEFDAWKATQPYYRPLSIQFGRQCYSEVNASHYVWMSVLYDGEQ